MFALDDIKGVVGQFVATEEIVIVGVDPWTNPRLECPVVARVHNAELGADGITIGAEIDQPFAHVFAGREMHHQARADDRIDFVF